MRRGLLLCCLLGLLLALPASADNPRKEPIPAPLQPWVEWVLRDAETTRCPLIYNQAAQHRCAWPSALTLDLRLDGGDFSQRWTVDAPGWLSLPGDRHHWPQDVRLDDQEAPVIEKNGWPALWMEPTTTGVHTVSGHFYWSTLPETLRTPPDTALLQLTVAGQPIAIPELATDGTLWLNRRTPPGEPRQDHVDLQVFRLLSDQIPAILTTRMELRIAGQARELVLGRVLPDHFLPLALISPLPARLEPDGRLRLQVRPGAWTVELQARHTGLLDSLTLSEPGGPWVEQEIWAFQPQNTLRLATLEGPPALDPAQTNLPNAWRVFPTYLLQPTQTLTLTTHQRGDADPPPDRLNLTRTLWLDFAGTGYTVQDQLEGNLFRSVRLETAPPLQLGRATVNGQDQFITRLPGAVSAGIELRQTRNLKLLADSRLQPAILNELPAVGWRLAPANLRTVLHLPPGWRLLSATGTDSVTNAWFNRWNLLDLFIVLIVALGCTRLWGWPWGILALAALVLTYHEPGAPRFIWLNALAAIALTRLLPSGWSRRVVNSYRWLSLLSLLALVLVFTLQQVRGALYPQLAPLTITPTLPIAHLGGAMSERPASLPPSAPDSKPRQALDNQDELSASYKKNSVKKLYTPDIRVQTGPGLPTWEWRQSILTWNGPVAADQRLTLWLLPPWATRPLLLLGVILVAGLLLRLFDPPRWPFRSIPPTLLALAFLPALLSLPSPVQAQEIPSPELLSELRARLTALPDCHPHCAALARLNLTATAAELRLQLTVHAQADTAIPLPLPLTGLEPRQISLDGQAAALYRAEQLLWVRLPAGLHTLEIVAGLPAALTTLQIPLPMPPGAVALTTTGWMNEGYHEGDAAGQIQLTRQRRNAETTLQPGVMPPFVQVERQLVLDTDWRIETRIHRLSQPDSAAVLAIPLLPGEQVTTPNVRVQEGQVLLNLSANQAETAWTATLERTDSLSLHAAVTTDFVEVWRLQAGPLWHIETDGPPPVQRTDTSGGWAPEWRPWPGETLLLHISRPEGVPGQTMTIDDARLKVTPGRRATDAVLELTIRASRGAEQMLTLPADATLTGAMLNGQSQPLRQQGQSLRLPLTPGTQRVTLNWRLDQGISTIYILPAVDLGAASVNNHLTLNLPRNRWPLSTGGPRLGPAVLFWGVLAVILVGAVLLGRWGDTPLGIGQWFLLGVGLSQTHPVAVLLVVGWLLLLRHRQRLGMRPESPSPWVFNLLQLGVILATLIALAVMLDAVEQGLLGTPDMQIAGNDSSAYELHWYQDRASGVLPQPWVVSLPLLFYRGLMLAWALWLAAVLLNWLRWGWRCFSTGGLWRRLRPAARPQPVADGDTPDEHS
ncbi:MAG: hypothetical protein U1F42_04365 [Candidatus Competibacteraceae bacterium]